MLVAMRDHAVTISAAAALIVALAVTEPLHAAETANEPPVPSSAATSTPTWLKHPDRAFSITATEVTVAQFRQCVTAGGCDPSTANEACNIGREDRADHPVNCVAYYGAEQFCAWAGGRVCSEDEWLAACRGSDSRAFPYGDQYDAEACNAKSTSVGISGSGSSTAPVGSFGRCEGGLPGLFDMAGNVAEWVDACKGTYCKFRGAGHQSNDPVDRFAGCSGVCSGNDKSLQSGVVGIRCCRDE